MMTPRQLHRIRSLSDAKLEAFLERWRRGPSTYFKHVPTSMLAAVRARGFAEHQEAAVLAAVTEEPGTCQELSLRLGIPENSCRPRLKRLELKGLVHRDGHVRKTASGCDAYVYYDGSPTVTRGSH